MSDKKSLHSKEPISKRGTQAGTKLLLLMCCYAYMAVAILFLWSAWQQPLENRLVPNSLDGSKIAEYLKQIPREKLLELQDQQRNMLVANPTDISTIKNLALLADLLGDKEGLTKLSLIAASRSLRDFPSQAVALQSLLTKKDYDKALYHIDGLLRSDPERHDQMISLLQSFAENNETLPSLVKLLKEMPPWRKDFISYLESNSKSMQSSYGLLSSLRSAGSPVSADELRPLLAKLISEKAYDRANYIWLDFLTEPELRKVSLIYDGGFDFDIGNRFFDWTYLPLLNVDLRLVPKSTGSVDRILRVSFSTGKTQFNNFYQTLRLPPGDYLLRGEQKTENLETNSGLVWRLTCLAQEPKTIASTEPLLNASSWKPFESKFVVPSEGCETQELRLANNARAYLDTQISGVAYFDNISVEPVADAKAQP